MNLYKITVKPLSAYCSPLQSDTFFGAFCWSYLFGYGEDALHRLLCRCKEGSPDIIFSNAFPSGRLPMPAGFNEFTEDQARQTLKYKKQKQFSTIGLDDFNRLINGTKEVSFHASAEEPEAKLDLRWRNKVSRNTDKAEDTEGEDALFETEQYFAEGTFDIFIRSSFAEEVLEQVLPEMFRYGIGARRSVGKGSFCMEGGLELFDGFRLPQNPDGFVALSNFVPQRNDPTDGSYKAFVKYPKVSFVENGEDSPLKKPIIFLKAGGVFRDRPVKEFYGSCIDKIALKGGRISGEIVVGAYTIAVPCRIPY